MNAKYDQWIVSKYYDTIAVSGIFVAIVMMTVHLLRISEKLVNVPWDFIEFAHGIIWSILFLIAASILISYSRTYQFMSSFIAGAVSFSFLFPSNYPIVISK